MKKKKEEKNMIANKPLYDFKSWYYYILFLALEMCSLF